MENLKTQIVADLKTKKKKKNSSKIEAIRAVKGAIDKFEKENPNQKINYSKAIKPLVKQREDSSAQFRAAGNEELANKELAEIEVINFYLVQVMPKQFSKDEMESMAKQYAIDNSLSKNDMGKIMSYFKTNYDGQYDGKELSMIAKTIL